MRSKQPASYLILAVLLSTASLMTTPAAAAAPAPASANIGSTSSAVADLTDAQQQQLDAQTTDAYERLDKWKGCILDDIPDLRNAKVPVRLVYKHNRSRAAATGFPTRLAVGANLGLTEYETAAVFGWTTGDYRLLNPIARGLDVVEFDEYPFLPNKMTKVKCRLKREEVMPYVRVLSSALSKLPALSSQQRLWRGHRRVISPSKVGSIVVMKGFTSVTRDRENALEFATNSNEGRSNRRTLIGILEHSSARAISKLSARPNEMEVLFPPDKTFEVVDPPGDTGSDDLKAVQRAAELMRKQMPEADIDLVYVREVDLRARQKEEEAKQPMHVIRKDPTNSPPIGEWE